MLPSGSFDGKVALITGGGTGIGLGIAERLASLGARVLLASRSEEHLGEAVEKIRSATGRADAAASYQLDVRDPARVEAVIQQAVSEQGRLDILVNNAAGNFICKAEDLSPNGWNAVVGIVLNGTFYCSAAAGRAMIAQKSGGAILNVIANYAWTGAAGVVHSASAKAGVLAMTQTLAVEWARHKIRVNAIAPGPVHTEGASAKLFPDERVAEGIRKTIPLRRYANLDEVANASAYLLSEYASYVTGASFVIDGGQWLSGADYWGRVQQMAPRNP